MRNDFGKRDLVQGWARSCGAIKSPKDSVSPRRFAAAQQVTFRCGPCDAVAGTAATKKFFSSLHSANSFCERVAFVSYVYLHNENVLHTVSTVWQVWNQLRVRKCSWHKPSSTQATQQSFWAVNILRTGVFLNVNWLVDAQLLTERWMNLSKHG